MQLRAFESLAAMAPILAQEIVLALSDAVAVRGIASLAVGGGRTPVELFNAISVLPAAWPAIGVTLTDERWVPGSDPASNARLVQERLLQNRARDAGFFPLYEPGVEPENAESAVAARISRLLPLDVCVIGMGEDGHIASIFPGTEGACAGPSPVAAVSAIPPAPNAPFPRMTLTLSALSDSRRLILQISGAQKRALLQKPEGLPIGALLALRPDLEVWWAED